MQNGLIPGQSLILNVNSQASEIQKSTANHSMGSGTAFGKNGETMGSFSDAIQMYESDPELLNRKIVVVGEQTKLKSGTGSGHVTGSNHTRSAIASTSDNSASHDLEDTGGEKLDSHKQPSGKTGEDSGHHSPGNKLDKDTTRGGNDNHEDERATKYAGNASRYLRISKVISVTGVDTIAQSGLTSSDAEVKQSAHRMLSNIEDVHIMDESIPQPEVKTDRFPSGAQTTPVISSDETEQVDSSGKRWGSGASKESTSDTGINVLSGEPVNEFGSSRPVRGNKNLESVIQPVEKVTDPVVAEQDKEIITHNLTPGNVIDTNRVGNGENHVDKRSGTFHQAQQTEKPEINPVLTDTLIKGQSDTVIATSSEQKDLTPQTNAVEVKDNVLSKNNMSDVESVRTSNHGGKLERDSSHVPTGVRKSETESDKMKVSQLLGDRAGVREMTGNETAKTQEPVITSGKEINQIQRDVSSDAPAKPIVINNGVTPQSDTSASTDPDSPELEVQLNSKSSSNGNEADDRKQNQFNPQSDNQKDNGRVSTSEGEKKPANSRAQTTRVPESRSDESGEIKLSPESNIAPESADPSEISGEETRVDKATGKEKDSVIKSSIGNSKPQIDSRFVNAQVRNSQETQHQIEIEIPGNPDDSDDVSVLQARQVLQSQVQSSAKESASNQQTPSRPESDHTAKFDLSDNRSSKNGDEKSADRQSKPDSNNSNTPKTPQIVVDSRVGTATASTSSIMNQTADNSAVKETAELGGENRVNQGFETSSNRHAISLTSQEASNQQWSEQRVRHDSRPDADILSDNKAAPATANISRDASAVTVSSATASKSETTQAQKMADTIQEFGERLIKEVAKIRPLTNGAMQLSVMAGSKELVLNLVQKGEWIEARLMSDGDEGGQLLKNLTHMNEVLSRHQIKVFGMNDDRTSDTNNPFNNASDQEGKNQNRTNRENGQSNTQLPSDSQDENSELQDGDQHNDSQSLDTSDEESASDKNINLYA